MFELAEEWRNEQEQFMRAFLRENEIDVVDCENMLKRDKRSIKWMIW